MAKDLVSLARTKKWASKPSRRAQREQGRPRGRRAEQPQEQPDPAAAVLEAAASQQQQTGPEAVEAAVVQSPPQQAQVWTPQQGRTVLGKRRQAELTVQQQRQRPTPQPEAWQQQQQQQAPAITPDPDVPLQAWQQAHTQREQQQALDREPSPQPTMLVEGAQESAGSEGPAAASMHGPAVSHSRPVTAAAGCAGNGAAYLDSGTGKGRRARCV